MTILTPFDMAIVRKAAFNHFRSGIPKETLESPRTEREPNSPEHHSTTFSASPGASGLDDTAITSPSTTISSFAKPKALAFSYTSCMISILPSALSGTPLSSKGRRINMAPYLAATGRNLSIFFFSPEMELSSALPG